MKKLFLAIMIMAVPAFGVVTTTSNMGLNVVSSGTYNWAPYMNQNAQIIDSSAAIKTQVAASTAAITGRLNGHDAALSTAAFTTTPVTFGSSVTISAPLGASITYGLTAGTITANSGITGTLTGSASLNVLKTGDTMSGNLSLGAHDLTARYIKDWFAGQTMLGAVGSGRTGFAAGLGAGASDNVGNRSTYLGIDAGYYSRGNDNTLIGHQAGVGTHTGYGNTFIGPFSGYVSSSSVNNVYLGAYTGYTATGSSNTLLGYFAGYSNTSGNGNILIGYNEQLPTASMSNYLGIGSGLIRGVIGGSSVTVAGALYADSFNGSASGLTSIPAPQLTGQVPASSINGSTYNYRMDGYDAALATAAFTNKANVFTLTNNFQNITATSMTLTGNDGGTYGLTVSSNVSLAGTLYTAGGRVGIGQAPNAGADIATYSLLQIDNQSGYAGVVKAASFNSNGTGGTRIEINTASGGSGANALLGFQNNGSDKWVIGFNDSGDSFQISENGFTDPKVTVLPTSGNVGIGTTNPADTLSVAGNISASGIIVATGSIRVYGATAARYTEIDEGYIRNYGSPSFYYDNAVVGAPSNIRVSNASALDRVALLIRADGGMQSSYGVTASSFTATGINAAVKVSFANGVNSSAYALLVSSAATGEHVFGIHESGHMSIGGYLATLGTCANGALVANSHDLSGGVEFSGTNSSCAVVFGKVMDAAPFCMLSLTSESNASNPKKSTMTASGFTIVPNTGNWAAGDRVDWFCPEAHE